MLVHQQCRVSEAVHFSRPHMQMQSTVTDLPVNPSYGQIGRSLPNDDRWCVAPLTIDDERQFDHTGPLQLR